ncbi:hypothetical protein Tco_1204030 [Tanacetum coccineum]
MTIKTQILDCTLALGTNSDLPILHYTRSGSLPVRIMEMEPDIENMTMNEYLEYAAENFTPNFYDQSPYTPNPQPENKELSFEEDITVKDVERLRQLLTPTVHTLPELNHVVQPCVPLLPSPDEVKVVMEEEPNYDVDSMSIQVFIINDDLIQPLIPQPIHTTPPDKDYVAPATKLILEELLEESEPFIHIKPLSPLYGVFKSPKSSTKPYKVEREMTSPPWILHQRDGSS